MELHTIFISLLIPTGILGFANVNDALFDYTSTLQMAAERASNEGNYASVKCLKAFAYKITGYMKAEGAEEKRNPDIDHCVLTDELEKYGVPELQKCGYPEVVDAFKRFTDAVRIHFICGNSANSQSAPVSLIILLIATAFAALSF